jgi:hypothetical protein
MPSGARSIAAWWGLFFLGILLIVMGFQGSAGRFLAVVVTPARLTVKES